MEYDEIKEKIVGWLEEKEQFRDKDLFFLFDDLAEEARRGLGLMVLKTWMRMRVLMWLILTA